MLRCTFEHEGNKMKKVLLATTALAMTAGMAAADVSLSGYAEIGVAGVDGPTNVDDDLQFFHDFDIKFTVAGETDSGLAFGATIDLDEVGDDGPTDPIGAAPVNGDPTEEHSVFISGTFGTITMGDTDGAYDWALSEIAWGTAIADDHTAHAGWNGNSGLDGANDGQIARYDYSFDSFSFAVSGELDDLGINDDIFGLGFKWNGEFGGTNVGVGIGYQDGAVAGVDADIIGFSVSADFNGGFAARVNYSQLDVGGVDVDHIGVGVSYSSGPLLLEANWGEFDPDGGASVDGFGVAANYDLGGGAVAMFGYGNDDDTDRYSLGLGMSF